MPRYMWDLHVQNIVASTQLSDGFDLTKIMEGLTDSKYDPHTFPGLVYRVKDPKTSVLLFRSGKAVFTGSTDLKMLEASVNKVLTDLRAIGQDVYENPKTEIQNMVSSADLGNEVNLNTTAITLGLEKVEYEPEQFPGLVYRINDPKVVILLFGSGKIVIAGAKRIEEAGRAVDNLAEELRSAGLLP